MKATRETNREIEHKISMFRVVFFLVFLFRCPMDADI